MSIVKQKLSSILQTISNKINPANKQNINKLEFNNCENLSDVFKIIKGYQNGLVLLVKISTVSNFRKFMPQDLKEITRACKNKSVVIFFTSKNSSRCSLFWKSNQMEHFLFLKSYTIKFTDDDKEIYEFISKILATSLSNGHLGLDKSLNLNLDNNQIDIYQIADHQGSNLLSIAKKAENENVISKFEDLKLYLLDHNRGPHLTSIAIKHGHYEVVLTLYEEDIPILMTSDIKPGSKDAESFLEKLKFFNQILINDDLEQVQETFYQLPRSRFYYNLSNKSALKVAIQNHSFKCYEFLWSKGVRFAPHESPEELYEELSYGQKKIREIHDKYTEELQEEHINVLISRSVLFDDSHNRKIKLELVQKAYQKLNTIPSIKTVLKVVAASKNFTITFDFNRNAVNIVDPASDSSTQGIFYITGRIYIGAKQLFDASTEHETLGNLAHELCHLAVHLVYRNNAKPYLSSDQKTMEKFEEISKRCQELKDVEDIIFHVYKSYKPSKHHAELIVRVVHMLALYELQPEKLSELRKQFGDLYEFYENKIVPEMEKSLPEITRRAAISCKTYYKFEELSNEDKEKVKAAAINYKEIQIQLQDLFPQNSKIYQDLTSDHLLYLLDGQILRFSDPHMSYLNDQVRHSWKHLTEKLKNKILNSNLCFQNEILKFSELELKISNSFNFLTSKQINDVLDGKELQMHELSQNRPNFYIERTFLDERIISNFLKFKSHVKKILNIRPGPYSLSNGKEDDYILIRECTEEKFKNFVNQRNEKFGKHIQNFDENFEYLFSFNSFHSSFEDILEQTEKSKMFILSDEAGTGKTAAFEEFSVKIKQKLPSRFVSYIDLKDHVKLFNKNEPPKDIMGVLKNILNLNLKTEFEEKIFEELFDSGNVILLWNGFDEISPIYSDFVLHLLVSIYRYTNNIQYVCTRPLYKNLLTSKIGVIPHTLVKFDDKKQQEFLIQFFTSVDIKRTKFSNYIEKVHKIVKELSWKDNTDFTTPLMLEMIADLISTGTEIYESENLWDIYEKFTKKKIKIWRDKSEFANEFMDSLLTDNEDFKTMRMYQMYALKTRSLNFEFRTRLIVKKLNIMTQHIPEELTSEEISRMGILYINGPENVSFAHRTFEEFFVAQFLIDNIYRPQNIESQDVIPIIQLFIDITKMFDYDQVMITKFIKSFLDSKKAEKSKIFHTKISKALRNDFEFLFFELTTHLYENDEIIEFLFKFFKKDHKLLIDLLRINEKESLYDEVIMQESLKSFAKEYLNLDEFEAFMSGQGQKGIVLFQMYCTNRHIPNRITHHIYHLDQNILEIKDKNEALDLISQELTNPEIHQLFLSICTPLIWSEFEMIGNQAFWEVVGKFLGDSDMKLFISNLFYRFSNMDRFTPTFNVLCAKAEEYLTDSEIFELYIQRNILHISAAHDYPLKFEELWKFIVNHSTESQQKQILQYEVDKVCFHYKYGYQIQNCHQYPKMNLFHILLIFPNGKSWAYANKLNTSGAEHCRKKFIKSLDIFEKIFTKSELREIVFKSNSFLPYFIDQNDAKDYQTFTNMLKNLFEGEEKMLKEFILRKIEPTDLNILEVMSDRNYNLKPFRDLLES